MNELAILTKAMIQERKDIAIAILGGFVAGIAGVCLCRKRVCDLPDCICSAALYLDCADVPGKILGLRAASRYAERLYSHRATFSLLSRLRTSFCQAGSFDARDIG